jgi:putative spermidine/putrescine transport system permease protein
MGRTVKTLTTAVVMFLLAPSLIILVSSVSPKKNIVFPPHGFTTHWYGTMFVTADLRASLLHSLYVGLESVVIGLTIGVPAALALYRYRMRGRAAFGAVLALGFASPLIASGVGFLLLFTELRILGHLSAVGLAITIVNFPFMLWALAAAISALDPDLEDAAATLGAEEVQQFLFVTLPGLGPGIVTGALLMFVFGITEFLVSLVLVNVNDQTLPVYLFGSIRENTSPLLAAVGALYIVVAGVIMLGVLRVGKLEAFLRAETR